MTPTQTRLVLWIGFGGLCAALAVAVTWWMMRPAPVVETAAAAVTQSDGSLVVERAPDAAAKPAHMVPKGTTVERVVRIDVRPRRPATVNESLTPGGPELAALGHGVVLPPAAAPCPSVRLDLSLVREQGGARRVIASSPDGDILRALDIPVETAAPPPAPHRWAAGLSYAPIARAAGAWIERDIGRVRLGLDINQTRVRIGGPADIEARLRVGVTW